MVNPLAGQKMVDYLTIFSSRGTIAVGKESDKLPPVASNPPRDFTVEDAVIQLERPTIKVHDPAWRPCGSDASAKFLLGAGDKASSLVRR
jgi:hypothetical protein